MMKDLEVKEEQIQPIKAVPTPLPTLPNEKKQVILYVTDTEEEEEQIIVKAKPKTKPRPQKQQPVYAQQPVYNQQPVIQPIRWNIV